MALRISFDLEEKDLSYFRKVMKDARAAAKSASEDEVLAKVRESIDAARAANLPGFVSQRVRKVARLVEMLEDEDWKLGARERANVLSALAYFADPSDLIPDEVPVLGYIDDAIMIELVVRELRPEIEAYEDFCKYREEKRNQPGGGDLAGRRKALHARMRRRRQAGGLSYRRSGGITRFKLF